MVVPYVFTRLLSLTDTKDSVAPPSRPPIQSNEVFVFYLIKQDEDDNGDSEIKMAIPFTVIEWTDLKIDV